MRRWGAVTVLSILFALKLVVVLAGANRGLDIGDDGVFLFCLNDPLNAPPLFEFYKLLAHFDRPLHFGLVEIRLLRVATELAATLLLAHAVFVWARVRFPAVAAAGFLRFALVALLGSLLSAGARGFGYNDATHFTSFVACACLFRVLALAPDAGRARIAWAAGAGFALGFQLFVKFPPALVLLGVTAVGVVWLPRVGPRARLATALAIGAGVATAIGLFLLSNGGVAPLVAKWRESEELNRVAGYGVADILAVYYYHDYASHVGSLWLWSSFAVVFVVARRLLRGRSAATDHALATALVVAAAVLAWRGWTLHAANVHPSQIYFFCGLLLLAPITWALALRSWRPPETRPELRRDEAFTPLLLLVALPFAVIAGTNVALTLKLPAHAAPVVLLLAITLPELARAGFRRFAAIALALLTVVTSAVFFEHQISKPYGLPSPLYRQVHETPLVPGLRVDVATRQLLEDLREQLSAAGFEPGDPVIALDFMPGLVWALGGRSPGFPFYAFDKPEQNCWAIERAGRGQLPFLILGQDMMVEQLDCIGVFAFPEDFRFVTALRNPYEAPIRHFFGGPPMSHLRVFAPIADTPK